MTDFQKQGHRIREKVVVQPPVHAYDQDSGINARLRYNIILGAFLTHQFRYSFNVYLLITCFSCVCVFVQEPDAEQ